MATNGTMTNGTGPEEEYDWEKDLDSGIDALKTKNLAEIEQTRKAGHEKIRQMALDQAKTNQRKQQQQYEEPQSPIVALVYGLISLVMDWFRLVAMGWASVIVTFVSAWIGIISAISAAWIGVISGIASGWIDVISFFTMICINSLQAINNTALKFIE